MKIIVADFTNEKINGSQLRYTVNTTLVKIGKNGGGLGGVDHFMCKSIKTIVSAYVRRLKRDESYGFPGASYNIEIQLSDGIMGPATDTMKIAIRCE